MLIFGQDLGDGTCELPSLFFPATENQGIVLWRYSYDIRAACASFPNHHLGRNIIITNDDLGRTLADFV
jgi:hypothetical protein